MSNSRKPRRRRTQAPGSREGTHPPDEPDLSAILDDEAWFELDLSLAAEAEGDIDAAIAHFEATPLAASAPHLRHLREIRELGDDAPGWVWSRLVLEQAHRWMLLDNDLRLGRAATTTLREVYRDEHPQRPRGLTPRGLGAEVLALDWMCRQVALYELGGLRAYLDEVAAPSLLRRADRIYAWSKAPMSGYEVIAVRDGVALLCDLGTYETRRALNIGHLAERVDQAIVGRLVPIRCEPGWMFESRPRETPVHVAELVAEAAIDGSAVNPDDIDGWPAVLGRAVRNSEMTWPLDPWSCLTPLSSDLRPFTWAAPHGVLSDLAFDVCVTSLDMASYGPRLATQAAPYLGAVLTDPMVFAAARERLCRPARAEAWRRLAENSPEPVRSRCLELASSCSEAA